MKDNHFYSFLLKYPWLPSLALWRGVEARLFGKLTLQGPVLDLGCGNGVFADIAFDSPLHTGCDKDFSQVRRAGLSGAYRHAVVADVCSLPFESRSFATIISNCVFEHIPDLGEALREAVRVLRPGGRLIFTVPTEKFNEWFYLSWLFRKLHLHGAAKKQIERYNRFQSHYHCYSVEEWTGILKDSGLRVEAHEYYASRGFAFLWSALDDTQHALARLMRVNKGTSSEAQASQMSERFTGSPVANLVARLCWVCLLPFHEGRVSSANRGAAILIQAVKPWNGNEAGAREW